METSRVFVKKVVVWSEKRGGKEEKSTPINANEVFGEEKVVAFFTFSRLNQLSVSRTKKCCGIPLPV